MRRVGLVGRVVPCDCRAEATEWMRACGILGATERYTALSAVYIGGEFTLTIVQVVDRLWDTRVCGLSGWRFRLRKLAV